MVRARRRLVWLAALAGLLCALPGPLAAEEQWGYELANELMSPFCPGRALAECPSEKAEELRQWILAQERAGVSREAVEAELFETWGDSLRQAPKPEGVGLVAYAIPAIVLLVGGGIVSIALRRRSTSEAAGSSPTEPDAEGPAPAGHAPDPELDRLLDDELRRT